MLVVKSPFPLPEANFVGKLIVGLGDVDQTTPLKVTADPPFEITLFVNDPLEVLVGLKTVPVTRVGVAVPASVVNVVLGEYHIP